MDQEIMFFLHKRITKLTPPKSWLARKKSNFFGGAPQTDFEPVPGLEKLTPRGHNKNKTKNEICFWKFWVFRLFFFRPKHKIVFSKNLKNSQNFRFSIFDFSDFVKFWDLLKTDFLFCSKIFRKKQKFPKTHFFVVVIMTLSSRCQIFKSEDRFGIGLRCLRKKQLSQNYHFGGVSFVIRLTSGPRSWCPKRLVWWTFWENKLLFFLRRHHRPIPNRPSDLNIWHRRDKIKTKRKIKCVFENFDFFEKVSIKTKIVFSKNLENSQNFQIFDFSDFVNF